MGIWELVASKAEPVKRNAAHPHATPLKNSHDCGSAALAKDHRTVAPANDISAKELETDRGVIDANGCTSSCTYGYGFTTFAKIGYTFRVKCIYRIVHMMKKDGTKSKSITATTSFSQSVELHESKAGNDIIPGQAVAMPMKKECMNSYMSGFITFAKIDYVRVNINNFGQWMCNDDTKFKMAMCSTILAKNVRSYVLQDCYKLNLGGLGFRLLFVVLMTVKDIMDEYQRLSKEKAGSPQDQSSGELKDEGRFSKVKEFFICLLNDIIAIVMQVPFRTQFFIKGVITMKSFALFVRELLACTMERHFGKQYLRQIGEIVAAIMKLLFSSTTHLAKDFEIYAETWMKSLSLIVRGLFVLIMKKHFGPHFWSQPEEMAVAIARALSVSGTGWTEDFVIHEATTEKRGNKKGKLNSLESVDRIRSPLFTKKLKESSKKKERDVEIETAASEMEGTKQEQEGSTEDDPSPFFSEEKADPNKIKEIRVNGKENESYFRFAQDIIF